MGPLVELDISLLKLYKHNRLSISGRQNQRASVSGWPDALAVEKMLLLCSICPSRLQGQRMCECLFPVDQMWVQQERDQPGDTVTPAQEDHMGGGGAKARGTEGIIPKVGWSL